MTAKAVINTQTSKQEESDDSRILLKKVKLKWAHLATPVSIKGNKPKYEVTIYDISGADIARLAAAGAPIKDGATKKTPDLKIGKYITARSTLKVAVVDANKKSLSDDEIKSIGNGTTANVKVSVFAYVHPSPGIAIGLSAVQIDTLVVYGGNATDGFDVVDGGYQTNSPF